MKNLKILEKILSLILPNRCLSCNQFIDEEEVFCSKHQKKAKFFEKNHDFSDISDNFDDFETVFIYNDLISKIVFDLKYYDQSHLKNKIGKLMSEKLGEKSRNYDLIIPVPLHKKRLKERKFNQSSFLAKEIIKYHKNLRFYPNFLNRKYYKTAQARLSQKERVLNLNNSFELNKKYENFIRGKNIILIDDVMTTGSTVNSCCEILKEAGCSNILVLTLAKTILKNQSEII